MHDEVTIYYGVRDTRGKISGVYSNLSIGVVPTCDSSYIKRFATYDDAHAYAFATIDPDLEKNTTIKEDSDDSEIDRMEEELLTYNGWDFQDQLRKLKAKQNEKTREKFDHNTALSKLKCSLDNTFLNNATDVNFPSLETIKTRATDDPRVDYLEERVCIIEEQLKQMINDQTRVKH